MVVVMMMMVVIPFWRKERKVRGEGAHDYYFSFSLQELIAFFTWARFEEGAKCENEDLTSSLVPR